MKLMAVKKLNIHRRIIFMLFLASFLSFAALGVTSFQSVHSLQDNALVRGRSLGDSVAGVMEEMVVKQTEEGIQAITVENAWQVEHELIVLREDTQYIANTMQQILQHPESYKPRKLPSPKDKRLAQGEVYLIHPALGSEKEIPTEIAREMGVAAHIADVLEFAIDHYGDNETSCYVASKYGYFIASEDIPTETAYDKLYTEAFLTSYDPRTRDWYRLAEKAEKPVFTDVYMGTDGNATIACVAPYYDAHGFAGAAGIDMRLESLYGLVAGNKEIANDGICFALNGEGEVVFSSEKQGILAVSRDRKDLRRVSDQSFAKEAVRMVEGKKGVKLVTLNGVEYCLAYVPMPAVGWSYGTLLRKDDVVAPVKETKEYILDQAEAFITSLQLSYFLNILVMLLLLIVVFRWTFLRSRRAAEKFVRPILALTDGVREIAKGDLDKKLDIKTGDEIETLADSVNHMTKELKEYMSNLSRVTADKERIATELNLARGIQEGMLPSVSPRFSEDTRYNLYATMRPAKEVGGDFYDFYALDEDRLVITAGDVSGKGIPAALFMVISKTVLKNGAVAAGAGNVSGVDWGKVVEWANRQLCESNEEMMFVTVFFGVLNIRTGDFTYVNAGHNTPLIGRVQGSGMEWEYLRDEKRCQLLGVMEKAVFEENHLTLSPGDMLYLYTDGVTEAMDEEGNLYGEDRVQAALHRLGTAEVSAAKLIAAIHGDVRRHVKQAEQSDDITMLSVRFLG